jgi:tetratricopeptide (TPR) repeat protein
MTAVDPAPGSPTEEDVDGHSPDGESEEASDPLGLEGERVDGYHVETLIGSGGMGIVYRARDPELGRRVALKFLPPGLARSTEVEKRFLREARSASALEHAHIATVYETGQAEVGRAAGQRFIAMAYYEGQTLRERLDRESPLCIEEAVDYAAQIADALARAHRAGIVHRDVKPANVMVTDAGTVKLLDFGLAKAAAATRLTETGRRLGTVAYMSPEQAAGEAAGPLSDLWALGSILYEMVGGVRPFDGERTAAILYAIQHEAPTPLDERRPDAPPALVQVVERCLQKDPADRYGSAEAVRDDLRALPSGTGGGGADVRASNEDGWPRLGQRELIGTVAALLVGLAVAASWAIWGGGKPSSSDPPRDRSVAVLPFSVSGEGAQTWRDGMVTMLSMNLDGAGGLRAIPDRRVFAAAEQVDSSALGDTSPALAVAERADARYAVVGSAVQLGETLRLGAEVFAVDSGARLGRVEVEGAPARVTALTDQLTRRVLDVLLEKSADRMPTVDLASITTSSLDALKAYLAGERHFRNGRYENAIDDFETAVERDSTFGLAYVRLGISKAWVGERVGIGRVLRQAQRFAQGLPRREQQLVETAYAYNVQNRWKAGVDSLRRLARLYPDDPTIWYYLGETLIYASVPGGLPESEEAFEAAVRLDPGVAPYRHKLAQLTLALHRDSALAARRIDGLPSGPRKAWYRTVWALHYGAPNRKAEAWARIDTVSADAIFTWPTIPMSLFHPTAWETEDRVLRTLSAREDTGPQFRRSWALHKLTGGRIHAAFSEAPNTRRVRREITEHRALGYPIPDSLLCSRRSASYLDPSSGLWQLQCVGISLIEQNREEELDEVFEHIRRSSTRPGAPPGTESQAALTLRSLQGYRAYRAGSLQVAAKHWDGFNFSGDEGAIWRGDLYRKLGRLKKAEGWYLAAWSHPLAHERLGRLYEQMDRPGKAQAAYRRFLAAWDGADPELQDWVDDARERVRALETGETDE